MIQLWHAFQTGDAFNWTGQAESPEDAATKAAEANRSTGQWIVFTGPAYRVNVAQVYHYEATSAVPAEEEHLR